MSSRRTSHDELPYTEQPFWYYPTRLTLGKVLLESGLTLEEEQVYRQNLKFTLKMAGLWLA